MSTDIAAMSFEAALEALEAVVKELEEGEVPLDASIALYERGAALRRHCELKLRDAQMKVDRIVAGSDGEATGTAPL